MGFLRQREDGSTSLAILTPSTGVVPGSREQPVSLGLLTGKITHGSAQLQSIREDKKNYTRAGKLTSI
jgi:bromodomain-containing protein 7/9